MATPLLKKLNHRDHSIVIVNAPDEFEMELDIMTKDGNKVTTAYSITIGRLKEIEFILSFVQTKTEVEKIINSIDKVLTEDAVVWFAYPKGTSKKYKAEINRDNGWDALGKKGFETVRSIAIDNDWTGLRFRKTEFIKTMKRTTSLAMSEKGKSRTSKK
jgi:hypothetical protein